MARPRGFVSVCSCVTATSHAQLGSIYIYIIIVEQVPHFPTQDTGWQDQY